MKLDTDCVRSVLMALEAGLVVDELGCVHLAGREPIYDEDFGDYIPDTVSWSDIARLPELEGYDLGVIVYTMQKLDEAGYIVMHDASEKPYHHCYCFTDTDGLTYEGHKFLSTVRDAGIWAKAKKRIAKIGGDVSLPILSSVASELIKAVLLGAD